MRRRQFEDMITAEAKKSFNSRLREEATKDFSVTFDDETVSTHASVRRRQGILGHFIAKGKRVLSANGIFPLLMYAFGTNQRTIVFVTQGAHNVKCHDLQAFRGKTFMNYISGTVNLHVRVKAVLREPRRSKMLSPSSRRKRKRLPTEKRSYPPIPCFNPKCTTF